MGKKKLRPSYTSKGGHGGRLISGKSERHPITVALDKWKAFKAGKKVFVTIPNPNPKETNKPWIRVEMKVLYGDHKRY